MSLFGGITFPALIALSIIVAIPVLIVVLVVSNKKGGNNNYYNNNMNNPHPSQRVTSTVYTPPAANKFCRECGAAVAADNAFCGKCGAKQTDT